jgi:hypothetical protein
MIKRYMAVATLALLLASIASARMFKDFIATKSDDGSVLKLGNKQVYVVDEVDRVDSKLWLPADDVIVDEDSSSCTHVQIINTDEDGESVCAELLRQTMGVASRSS